MIVDGTILQEYIQDAKEQLTSLGKLFKKSDISKDWLERENYDLAFEMFQSINVGACFFGLRPITRLINLLKELLLLSQDAYHQDKVQSTESLHVAIGNGIEHLKIIFADIHANNAVQIADFEKETFQWGITTSNLKDPMMPMTQRYFENQGYKFFKVGIFLDRDLVEKGRDILEFLQSVENIGNVFAIDFDMESFPTLDTCLNADFPSRFYIAFLGTSETLSSKLGIPQNQIKKWTL